ncbi:ATP synthase subunit I [Pleurocapsales cyanobacterium LEGE 06147]|nr:ATP synthase subunit I [Pleurocapsales cyanobacterium LEGE 06147]
MENVISYFIATFSGILLGIFYFSSLWITVRQLPTAQRPIRLFVGSLLGRLVITLLGFYLVMDGHWQQAIACLIGFLIARTLLIQRLRPQ